MGKGSKKRNLKEKDSEKSEGGDEKPLPKLVLKVGKEHKKLKELKGEPSVEAQNVSESEHGSHHKKKKKKHKHRAEEEKKSKKRELPVESNEHETPTKKIHLRVKEKEKKPEPKEREISAFHLCLENLHRNLQRKDVYNIFQFPVSDAVAPGYSKIIKVAMDFLSMSFKIEKNEYLSLEQFKADFVLMCNNAMLYNGSETIYYKSADKMLQIGLKMLSKEKMKKMSKSLRIAVSDSEDDVIQIDDEANDVDIDLVNTSAEETIVVPPPTKKKSSEKKKKEALKQKTITESILAAAHKARQKLLEKHPKQLYGYLSKDIDGNSALNVLNPDVTEETKSVPVTLEKLAPKPQGGLPAGQGFKEEKKNRTVPVNYLLYGPYGSFGPTYDSSLSNITKEESDLLLQTYGSELGVSYTRSLQSFAKDSSFAIDYVDRILDSITDGAHNRHLKKQKDGTGDDSNKENKEQLTESNSTAKPIQQASDNTTEQTTTKKDGANLNVDIESLLTLDGLGIDVSFLKEIVKDTNKDEKDAEKSSQSEELLSENAKLLHSLKSTQYKRLSTKHGGTIPVGEEELNLANTITHNLKELIKGTAPKDVVSTESVRKAIGTGTFDGTQTEADNNPLDLSFEDSAH